ncbi:MAG: polyprenyl synthetase family protein [Dehalococcoidia bacterium]|nr:polyprenyl synthetase family protein [Dehalococcoidia bacterium]
MTDLEQRAAVYRPLVQHEMRAVVGDRREPLFAWMRYHLGWEEPDGRSVEAPRGKMLRPVALLLATELCGGDARAAVPAAAAVELVHNFSLLHDDVEDASERRHHRPTLWTFAGAAQAINTGDGMYTVARLAMYRLLDSGVAVDSVLAAMSELDAACLRLVAGQQLDIAFEQRRDVTPEEYLEMTAGKSAAMFAAPFAIGALLAGAAPPVVDAFRRYGLHVGLAFQAVDDVLGIWGDTEVTGKPVGDDLASRKMSYPVVAALSRGGDEAALLARAYAEPPGAGDDIERLTGLVVATGGLEATEGLAREHQAAALEALRDAGLSAEVIEVCSAYANAAVGRVA